MPENYPNADRKSPKKKDYNETYSSMKVTKAEMDSQRSELTNDRREIKELNIEVIIVYLIEENHYKKVQ